MTAFMLEVSLFCLMLMPILLAVGLGYVDWSDKFTDKLARAIDKLESAEEIAESYGRALVRRRINQIGRAEVRKPFNARKLEERKKSAVHHRPAFNMYGQMLPDCGDDYDRLLAA